MKQEYTTVFTYLSICASVTRGTRHGLVNGERRLRDQKSQPSVSRFSACGSEVIFTRGYSQSGSHRPRLARQIAAAFRPPLLSSSQPFKILSQQQKSTNFFMKFTLQIFDLPSKLFNFDFRLPPLHYNQFLPQSQ